MVEPTVVSGLDRWLDRAGKIVSASHLSTCWRNCGSSLRRAPDCVVLVSRVPALLPQRHPSQ